MIFSAGEHFLDDLHGSGVFLDVDDKKPSLSSLPGMTYRRSPGVQSILTFCDEYCKDLLGYNVDELISEPTIPFYRLIHPDDREETVLRTRQAVQNNREYELEYRMLTRDKQSIPVVDRGRTITDDKKSHGIEGIITEVPNHTISTSVNEDEGIQGFQSRYRKKYDFLTDMPNRHWFLEKVDAKLQSREESSATDSAHALAFLDLDNFQQINDFFGRDTGDRLIKKVALMLTERLNDTAVVGRVSGDRFGLFFSGWSSEDLKEELRDTFRPFARNFQVDGVEHTQEFSIGIAQYPDNADSLENLVTATNRALKRAKTKVNEKIATFRKSDRERLNRELNARQQILRALDQDRLEVFYQPIVDARTEEPSLYEALLRVNTDDGRTISIKQFKEATDDGKISRQLDRIVFDQALSEFSEIVDGGDVMLAVNLFPPSVIDWGCFKDIDSLLEKHPLRRDRLIIEVPETLMLSHRDRASDNIQRAAEEYDIRFALDDFGVGHGSFKSLNSFPIDFLKIDGTFIQDLPASAVEQKFVEMTAGLADQMDLTVIGEWIENHETAELLQELGVHHHQGYYYSHPAPGHEWDEDV
jgi:diguanylate cyclase (GGDEF)-like protein